MINNLLADVLMRIHNATIKKHLFTYINYNTKIINILKFLTKKNFIKHYSHCFFNNKKNDIKIKIILQYFGQWHKISKINFLRIKQKTGILSFIKVKELTHDIIKNNKQGTYILSTTSGLMTNVDALNYKKGGKLICFIK